MMPNFEKAFELVAFSSLKENGEEVTPENINYESGRIHRMVDHFYKTTEHDMHYDDFIRKFLLDNFDDIVYTDKYLDQYLDDVPEPRPYDLEEVL